MKVLIDGDSLVYTIGFASQKNIWQVIDDEGIVHFENESKQLCLGHVEDQAGALGTLEITRRIEVSPVEHAFHSLKVIIQKIAQRAKANSYKIYLTGAGNFREGVATIMGYKHNRLDAEKPLLYQQIRDYLVEYQKATIVTGMEADDALSIVYARSISGEPVNVSADPNHEVLRHPDECVIAAIDKDLRNIPGKHINFDKRVAENDEYKFIVIDEDEGRLTFWKQVLTGDSSDNILGIPGMGPKKADALLDPIRGKSEEDFFWAVYGAYKHYYGTESFEYLRYDAYVDTTATFRKREARPDGEITPEQRLVGSALTMLLENARLLWMLRVAPNAEGTHWWMPPLTFEEIAIEDETQAWVDKEAALKETKAPEGQVSFIPWTEGRGKWFWSDEDDIRHGKFSTKKKATADMKEYQDQGPNTSDGSEAEGFVQPTAEPGPEDVPTDEQPYGTPNTEGPPVESGDAAAEAEDTQVDAPVIDRVYYNLMKDNMWGFYSEDFTGCYGPYDNEEEARQGLANQIQDAAIKEATPAAEASEVVTEPDDNATALPETEIQPDDNIWDKSF